MWSVALLRPNQGHIATRNLLRQGYHYFFPQYETKKVVRHRWQIVSEPVFLNYLFVQIRPDQRWVPLNYTYGIRKLLTSKADERSEYDEPSRIPDNFITRLMHCSDYKDKTWQLRPGTLVKVLRGPFAGYEAPIVSWPAADRCRLIVWLLNRDVELEIRASDIDVVEPRVEPLPPRSIGHTV